VAKPASRMTTKLFDYQQAAVDQLKTGSILFGGVGSGKTRTSIAYYYKNERPKDLYVITTAAKRDKLDWERECASFMLSRDRTSSIDGVSVTVDSWNNIKKYIHVEGAFFIFDEQRLVGSGVWVKSFLKISRNNAWILLSATPGDSWLDYIPVFIANGFYKNRTEFIRRHVVYNTFTKFPKVDHYVEESTLRKFKSKITVVMQYTSKQKRNYIDVVAAFDETNFKLVSESRWNPYTNLPIKDITELFFTMRKIVNSDPSRLETVKALVQKHRRVIVFYNFNYELEILRSISENKEITVSEYNGHRHDPLPNSESWVYLVQYMSGSEGWNCTETNTIIFYSQSYSYRMMVQAAGRIDRLNSPFMYLFYYSLISDSQIDKAIKKALKNKKNFNERRNGFISLDNK